MSDDGGEGLPEHRVTIEVRLSIECHHCGTVLKKEECEFVEITTCLQTFCKELELLGWGAYDRQTTCKTCWGHLAARPATKEAGRRLGGS